MSTKTQIKNKKNKTVPKKKTSVVSKRMPKAQASPVRSRMQDLINLIALYLTSPGEDDIKAFRVSSAYNNQPTALATPFRIVTLDAGLTAAANGPYFAANQGLMCLFRGVECSAIVYNQNASSTNKTYSPVVKLQNGTIALGVANGGSAYSLNISGESFVEVITPYAKSLTAYAPHGPILYAGSVQGTTQRFLWVDAFDIMTINAGAGFTGNISYYLDRYDQNGLTKAVKKVTVAYAGGIAILTTLKANNESAGYYALRINNDDAADVVFPINDINIGGGGACMAHLTLPDLDSNLLTESGVRVTALSMMYTNTSTLLELGGNISGYQFGTKDDWLDLLVTDVSSLLQKKKGSFTRDIRKGLHGFLKPTQPSDFDFKSYTEVNSSGIVVDSAYPLDDRGAFIAMAFSLPGNGAGNEALLTFRYGIEILSSNTWFDLEVSDVPEEAFKAALVRIRDVEPFHENPVHLRDIWEKIKSGASKAFGFLANDLPKIMGVVKGLTSNIPGAEIAGGFF